MSEGKGYICELFDKLDNQRLDDLEMARRCARLSQPYILPDKQWNDKNRERRQRGEEEIPNNFQSLGARACASLLGHFLQNGFPSESPWTAFEMPGSMLYDPRIPDEWKVKAQNDLFMAQLVMLSTLESAPIDNEKRQSSMRNSAGFRAGVGSAIDSAASTGDSLILFRDDYRLRTYRRDFYVTKRDTSRDVLCHVTKEQIDPMGLSAVQRIKADLYDGGIDEKPVEDRMQDLYTYVEWQPVARTWTITQEVNGHEIQAFDEEISPFISAPFKLVDGDDYGRGFIEMNYGDFSTFDRLEEACLDYAAIASKMHPVVDPSSLVRDKDFTARTGTPIRNVRVVNGVAQDIGFLQLNKMGDFGIVQAVRDAKRKDLGAAALLESEAAPKGEAGRHSTAWKMVYGELQRVTGGLYPGFMENLQLHLVRRAIYQLQRDKLIAPFNLSRIRIRVLTGLAAMEREERKNKLLSFAQFVQALGPQAQARIDPEVAWQIWSRYDNFYEPGLMKSEETMQREMQSALRAQAASVANEKAVEVIGDVAKANLLPAAAA